MNERLRLAWLPLLDAARSVVVRRYQFALVFVTLVVSFWSALEVIGVTTGLQRQVESDLQKLGPRVINVHANPHPLKFFSHKLTLDDVEIFARLAGGIAAPANLAPAVAGANSDEDAEEQPALLIGTTPRWNDVVPLEFVRGRFFRDAETDACVCDEWIYTRLFPDAPQRPAETPTISLKIAGEKRAFRVVGVVRDPFRIRENFEEWDITGTARSPIVRLMEYKSIYLPREAMTTSETIVASVVLPGEGVDSEVAAERIREHLEKKQSTALAWSRKWWASEILGAVSITSAISNFVWILILTITAFMVVTVIATVVRERYGEIAIRRVEGARRWQIATQLVAENIAVTTLAALCGWLLAWPTSRWLETSFYGWPVPVRTGDFLLILAGGIIIIGLTTLVPACRAASLDPASVLGSSRR